MQYLKDLPIKYITGTYKVISDMTDFKDITMLLVDTIKGLHKSKKNWECKDFVISQDRFDSLNLQEDITNKMFENEFLVKDEVGTIQLTEKTLKLIFEL